MRQYRLPFGDKITEDDQEYIDAWRALMLPILSVTTAKEFALDPDLVFKHDWQRSSISVPMAKELCNFIERWKRVEDMCKDHFHSIEVEGRLIDHLDDDMHYIFEAAMEATFGRGIWPKYNTLNHENSEREYKRFQQDRS